MIDDQIEHDRLVDKLGREISYTDPHVSGILHRVLYDELPAEDALVEMVRILHARATYAEDALLLQRFLPRPA